LEAFVEAARHEPSADSLTVAPVEVAADETLAGPEWWERLASRWLDWRQRHQQLAERWAQVRAVALWLALAGLLVVFVLFPEFRAGLRVWVWLYGLLVAWFFVARTKTVAWRLLARVFGTAVWWSVIIAVISMWLASRAGGVRGDGPGTVIAGMTEESLKLVPLAALALAAPSRVRRLAVVDWLLLGLACGLGFQAFEELARRTSAAVVRPGLLDVLDRLLGSASGSQAPQYGWSLLAGGWNTRLASYAGHHVLTALVAVSVGVGVAAWRRGARLAAQREGAGKGWRVLAVAGPLAMWWLVVADHAGFNATASTSSRAWAQAGDMPRLLRVTWDLTGHGFGRGWLLLVLLLAALLVDARHLRRGEASSWISDGTAEEAAPTITDGPGLVADRWASRLSTWQEHNPSAPPAPAGLAVATRWATAVVAAACALAAYAVRDLRVLVGAHARQPDESRLDAISRGRLAMGELHHQRVEAIAAAAPSDTTRRRRRYRAVALLGLVVLLSAGLLLAPALARYIGPTLTATPFGWLAGALDALGGWWDGLGLGGQIAVGLGIAALIALSGGARGTSASQAYQIRIYGEREPLIHRSGQTETWADGLNQRYGSVGDAKFRDSTSSFYDPHSLHRSVQPIARRKLDTLLLKYTQAIDDPTSPARTLEIMTNDPQVARAFAQRMRALGVRGYVVINR
jgi:RsiW-degrading membrane proteinase PrsW (M82 family)